MIFFGTIMSALMAFLFTLIVAAYVTDLLWTFVVLPILVIVAVWELAVALWHWRP